MSLEALFQPFALGPLDVPHRVVMAPLTRCRSAQPGNVPHALNAEYYAQRASAAFIVSEATQVSQQGQGYAWTPGVHSAAQTAGWKLVTDAVHAAGGRIFAQLWHVGRISHRSFQPDGGPPVAPSAIGFDGQAFVLDAGEGAPGFVPLETPRALGTDEIAGVVGDFARAAENAKAAGFDGVEIHGANGYLVHAFLETASNHREDAYGGSIVNRMRFLAEILDAVTPVFGPERVGVRLSPGAAYHGMGDEDPVGLYSSVADLFAQRNLAYAHLIRPNDRMVGDTDAGETVRGQFRARFAGALIMNGGYGAAEADAAIARGDADLVAFGRPYIANPDLPERFRAGAELAESDAKTHYGGGAEGYTDYPALIEAA